MQKNLLFLFVIERIFAIFLLSKYNLQQYNNILCLNHTKKNEAFITDFLIPVSRLHLHSSAKCLGQENFVLGTNNLYVCLLSEDNMLHLISSQVLIFHICLSLVRTSDISDQSQAGLQPFLAKVRKICFLSWEFSDCYSSLSAFGKSSAKRSIITPS